MEKINYQQTVFLSSAAKLSQLPADKKGEVAFIGRSNVGKSSVINALCRQNGLAKVSKTPGRTQLLNFFPLQQDWYLVDLPGYGYAKVPSAIKKQWQQTLESYLKERETLRGLVLLMDIRHPLKEADEQMLTWCHYFKIPVHIVLNKADKLSRGAAAKVLQQIKRHLAESYQQPLETSVQTFSVLKKQGIEALEAKLDSWLLKI